MMVAMAHNRPSALARCLEPGCAVRYAWPGATDHPCGEHDQPTQFDFAAAAAQLGIGDLDASAATLNASHTHAATA